MNKEQVREEIIKIQKLIRLYESEIGYANWNIKMLYEDIEELMKYEVVTPPNSPTLH